MKKRVGKLASGAKAGAVLLRKPNPKSLSLSLPLPLLPLLPLPLPLALAPTLALALAPSPTLTPDQVLLRKGRGGAEEDDDLEDGAPHVT